jgi:hypothetical protein
VAADPVPGAITTPPQWCVNVTDYPTMLLALACTEC